MQGNDCMYHVLDSDFLYPGHTRSHRLLPVSVDSLHRLVMKEIANADAGGAT